MSRIEKGKWQIMSCGQKKFELTVLGKPQPQQRVRVYSVNGHAVGVDPKKSRENKENIRALATQKMLENRLSIMNVEMPVSLSLNIYKPIPKGKPKFWRRAAMAGYIVPTTHGGDVDNILKGVMDALNGVVYADDCQVFDVSVRCFYDETPRLEISVWGYFQNLGDIKEAVKKLDYDNRTMEVISKLVESKHIL